MESEINTIEITGLPFLLEKVRHTKILGNGQMVYESANKIELRTFNPLELSPTALYVVKGNLNTILILREVLLKRYQIDLLHLSGIVSFHDLGDGINDGVIGPPVVELTPEGELAIIDGQHRLYIALIMGESVDCIYVEGVSVPTVSVPVSWESISIYDKKPEDPGRLRILREGISDIGTDIRNFYRDFSFLGSSGRRPRVGQES